MESEHTAVITNAPDRIFLNMGFDEAEGDVDFKACEEVTWCVDRQSPRDIEYVRVATLNSEAHERAWACYNALANVADPADAMRKSREFIDGLTPCDESIKTPELGICACSDCQTYRQAQKVLAAIGGGK